MEALYKINNNTTIKVESETPAGLVQELTKIREAIGPEKCGKCDSINTYANHRKVGDDDFYEIRCKDCDAVLQLGMSKADGTLYKKRMRVDKKGKAVKDKNGKGITLPNNGWLKWNPETKTME